MHITLNYNFSFPFSNNVLFLKKKSKKEIGVNHIYIPFPLRYFLRVLKIHKITTKNMHFHFSFTYLSLIMIEIKVLIKCSIDCKDKY